MMEKGTVKWYSEEKGWGFLRRSGGPDVFVHVRHVLDQAPLAAGEWVSFEVRVTPRGLAAFNVRRDFGAQDGA